MSKIMNKGRGVVMGMLFGAAIGIATGNIGLWLSLGIVFGAAYDAKIMKKMGNKEDH